LAGGLNLYGFAGGDPVNFSDPFGLLPCCTAQDRDDFINAMAARRSAINHAVATFAVAGVAGGVGAAGEIGGAAISTLGVAGPIAGRTLLPAVPGAVSKLQNLAEQFGIPATQIANRAITSGMRLVDNGNSGNINTLLPRPDGASGWIRVTLDPTQSRIISAGWMKANQITNGLQSGRFTPPD